MAENKSAALGRNLYRSMNIILLCFISNSFVPISKTRLWFVNILSVLIFVLINVFPSLVKRNYPTFRLRACSHGAELLIYFVASTAFSCAFQITAAFLVLPKRPLEWSLNLLACIIYESIVFWNGMISVYLSSLQLGIRSRVIGLICGWIPIANIIALFSIIKTAEKEVNLEIEKSELNKNRAALKICETKYPILMVHGVFFRDTKYFNYWGRVPKELERNGAVIFYGNHESASSVEDSARELSHRIGQIVKETGCEKLNIIAHSKGGLDCRCAISKFGAAKYVASLTTINTPHRGCGFADYLLKAASPSLKDSVAGAYNSALKRFGDKSPDFISAVSNLTEEYCSRFNEEIPDVPGVRYRSVGSKLNHAANGKFPLNFSYLLVKHFDGANDGLVSEKSFPWGEKYIFLTTAGKRGISHGDMIDLNRENIDGFDVREFYVQLAAELKSIGL